MIRLRGVGKSFGRAPVLSGVALHVPAGSTLGLIGPGDAGKSLILKMICGLVRPDEGQVEVDGQDLTSLTEPQLMAVRGRIGMVFQNYALFDYLDVAGNIGFPLRQLGELPREAIEAKVRARLSEVHLPGIERLMPGELSGGMKKRVCLARATIHDPPIMLCDDPTAGLDPVTTNRIFGLLKRLQQANAATAIIVSHEVAYLLPLCDQVAVLDGGRLLFVGTPAQAAACEAPVVRQLVTGEGIE